MALPTNRTTEVENLRAGIVRLRAAIVEDTSSVILGMGEEIKRLHAELAARDKVIERLRARGVMLLKCHYEEHKHIGSPTCFDVQSPSDEWENKALIATNPD